MQFLIFHAVFKLHVDCFSAGPPDLLIACTDLALFTGLFAILTAMVAACVMACVMFCSVATQCGHLDTVGAHFSSRKHIYNSNC